MEKLLLFSVLLIVKQEPVQSLLVVPLNKLTEFRSHEDQLFSGVRHHVAKECTHTSKFLLIVAGHFVNQRPFPMHYFIM